MMNTTSDAPEVELPEPLYKTTIVVFSTFNPTATGISESDLVRDAETGDSIISSGDIETITTSADVPYDVLHFHFSDEFN